MAVLGDTQPVTRGGNYLPVGIHRVQTGVAKATTVGQKNTPLVEQELTCPESGQSIKHKMWATPKSLPWFAGYVQALGVDAKVRATIDPEVDATMVCLANRWLWVLVEDVYNEKAGRAYREVTNWAEDGDMPNWPKPEPYRPRNSFGSSGSQDSESALMEDGEEIPFGEDVAPWGS